jgi:hypothetical protein
MKKKTGMVVSYQIVVPSDYGCKQTLQPTSKHKGRGQFPAIRINKAKGHSYVQVKGYRGMNNWVTVGKATPKNLGYAERIVRDSSKSRVSDEINELGKIHGLLDTKESKQEYSDASREHPFVDYNIHEDELETAFDEAEKFHEKSTKSMHRTRERQGKAAKKAMKKLV